MDFKLNFLTQYKKRAKLVHEWGVGSRERGKYEQGVKIVYKKKLK
jgi:hypothetical protein